MGLLVNGQWHDRWYNTEKNQGEFIRKASQFRNWITIDGQAGPTGSGGFMAESGRYHLYVSYACPWAHRTLIFRRLKELEGLIDISVVSPDMLESGWEYSPQLEPNYGFRYHYQLYTQQDPNYTGRVTVPVLWDKQQHTIVSNESSEIIRMFNSAFNHLTGNDLDYYPKEKREAIDAINKRIYTAINNGVYRCGFATQQKPYEKAFDELFSMLDDIEQQLQMQRYLLGEQITEADWRLFTTLIRFDCVYYSHFKCNQQRIEDYPNLSGYLRDLYQQPGIANTVNFEHIKRHYYFSHESINPYRIIPKGPVFDYTTAHDRG